MTFNARIALFVALMVATSLAHAVDLSPEVVAKIQLEERAAVLRVERAHGNKSPSELSPEERKEIIQEQEAAVSDLYERHGVTAKDFARYTAKMSTAEREAVQAAMAKIVEKEEKKLDAAQVPVEQMRIIEPEQERVKDVKPSKKKRKKSKRSKGDSDQPR
jgi:hypothetical protein